MVIVLSGSSGAGKTEIAKDLAKILKFSYVDVNEVIRKNNLRGRYIKKFNTYEVDVKKLNRILIKIICKNKNLIIDSHLSHYLPSRYVDYCIICKCDIKVLKKRLEKRDYNEIKVRENLDSEIFDVCLNEALENKHKVIVLDTSKKNIKSCIKEILKKLR